MTNVFAPTNKRQDDLERAETHSSVRERNHRTNFYVTKQLKLFKIRLTLNNALLSITN